MKWTTCVLVVALALVGCRSESETDAPPMGTIVISEYEASWSPAWEPGLEQEAGLETALQQASLWLLLPGSAPEGLGAPMSADIRITRSQPAGEPGADLVVRRGDESVYMSLQIRLTGDEPVCERLLNDPVYAAWSGAQVRGRPGCALPVDGAVSFVKWTEAGQDFHAEFPAEVAMADVVTWLASWEPAGAA